MLLKSEKPTTYVKFIHTFSIRQAPCQVMTVPSLNSVGVSLK